MNRRSFLAALTKAVESCLGLALLIPGMAFLVDPLRRSRKGRGFVRVAALDAIQDDLPVRATVTSDRWDAYVHHPPGRVGQVWLVHAEKSEEHVRCLHTVCPHLGCLIDYSPGRGVFECPCHASVFDEKGHQLVGPSPRDMDSLPVRVSEPDDEGRRWVEVKYREFQTGVPEQRPVA